MKGFQFLKGAVASLACAGTLLAPIDGFAAAPKAAPAAKKEAVKIVDIELTKEGALEGEMLNAQGVGVEGAVVKLVQGKKQVAQVVTDKNGKFEAKGLKGGVYQVSAGNSTGVVRAWSNNTAPKSALSKVVMVAKTDVVRAQDVVGGVDVITVVIGAAALTGAGFAIANNQKIDDLEDDIEDLKTP